MSRDLERQLEWELASALEGEWEGLREWEQPPACPKGARETVSRFPRYSNAVAALPPGEQAKAKAMGASIVANQRAGCVPMLRVQLVGHADRGLARERTEPGFMSRISRQRALAVKTELERLLN